ncbi:MAG TPA: hypothetical protein VHQ66_02330 [Myxococcota bacterium]|nr:hypothetical protein [Myxococcota bacterium]
MSGDDDERPRLSWSEIDKRRDRAGGRRDAGERRPRGAAAEARARRASQAYLKDAADKLFGATGAGPQADALARAVRDANGTPRLAAACAEYVAAVGPPRDAALAAVFLDADAREAVLAGLAGLAALRDAGRLELSRALRGRLRFLAEGPDDEIAAAAEALALGT